MIKTATFSERNIRCHNPPVYPFDNSWVRGKIVYGQDRFGKFLLIRSIESVNVQCFRKEVLNVRLQILRWTPKVGQNLADF